jgi:gamma-glutamyltranspeptidase/glutathione hydrolase
MTEHNHVRVRPTTVRAPGAMVAAADQLATQAGLAILAKGGNAVDAAIATNAAIAVTGPHLCGMGGDLFALIHDGSAVHALDAAGRAGSGSDSARLRAEGHREMPFRHDIRTVTVPGCVDGWCALHERFGSLALDTIFAPAIELAEHGFPASPLLVGALALVDEQARSALDELARQARRPGDRVRRPGLAEALRAVAAHGRDAFYRGGFGAGLMSLGGGVFTDDDLTTPGSSWVEPLSTAAFGRVLHTMPPVSQGYLLLGAAQLADSIGLSSDPNDPEWAHVLIEAAKAAGRDRSQVLADGADGNALLRAIAQRQSEINLAYATTLGGRHLDGDTTYLCVVDRHRMGVSLIQSNASGFGSWIVEPTTGINLHNRGLGFSLVEGHPAELLARHRPPHTLSPALATHPDGSLSAVFGTMGGDAQPQILLQLAARLFAHGQRPADAVSAPRWALRGPVTGFDTWTSDEGPQLAIEANAPLEWQPRLTGLGHDVRMIGELDLAVGHAHAIVVDDDGMLSGAADPRAIVGAAAGI